MREAWMRPMAYVLLLAGMVLCRADFLDDVFYNIDEGEYAAAADALSHGWLPGLDLLGSSKTPAIVVFCYTLFHLFGRSLAVTHVAQLIAVIATGFLVIEIARRLWGSKGMIPAALLFWIASNSFSLPQRILSLNVESPGVLLAVLALWLLLTVADSKGSSLCAGIALGIAVMFRQSFVFFLIPALYLAFVAEPRWRAVRIVMAGFAVSWMILLIPYALRGGLGWAFDSWVRYPLDYASDIGLSGYGNALWLNSVEFAEREWPVLLLAMAGIVALWRNRSHTRSKLLFFLALGSFLALSSGSRFTGQYWIQIYPALALFAAAGWVTLAQSRGLWRFGLAALVAVGVILCVGHFPFWRVWDQGASPKGVSPYALGDAQAEKLAGDYARERTAPDETILVWGYCPQIYYHAHRLPGVRDYIMHYVTGFSPGAFQPLEERAPRASSHPRAQQMFLDDLANRRPKYIFDLSDITAGEFPFVQYPITLYPPIATYLRAHYEPDTILSGVLVYRWKLS